MDYPSSGRRLDNRLYGQHIDRHPDEVLEQFRILGEKYARSRARTEYLEDMKKVALAEIKSDIAKLEEVKAETKLERMALAHPLYRDFLEKLYNARSESYADEVNYKAEDKKIELLRSLETSARAQLNKT